MRNCIDEGTLQAWFDGELDANAAAQVTAHLPSCVSCAEASRTLEAENLILSEGLSAEFAAAIPTERLRQRVEAAVAGLHVASAIPSNRSWWSALGDLLPSFRVLAYASATAAVLLAGWLAVVYLKRDQPDALVTIRGGLPEIALVTLKPDQVVNPTGPKPSNAQPPREVRPIKRNRPVDEQPSSLAWQERQYERAIAKLNEALNAQAPLRPSLRVEYEYNLAVIDNAITTTRDVARKNPNDPQATQFMLAAYQSKIDLMNQIADARVLER
jgi:hypothetical protein